VGFGRMCPSLMKFKTYKKLAREQAHSNPGTQAELKL
jgi:hypothetical protein